MTRSLLRLSELVFASLQEHFFQQSYLKMECCGFLLGQVLDREAYVTHIVRIPNLSQHSHRFSIYYHDKERVDYIARKRGLSNIGIYHSHPNGKPELSSADREAIKNSDLLWVVLAPGKANKKIELKAYQAGIKPLEIEILYFHISEPNLELLLFKAIKASII